MFYGEIENSGYEVIDESFHQAIIGHARLERLWSGARWLEGPAYFPAFKALIFSDIPNNRMMMLNETSGQCGVFREPSNNSNGNTLDKEGRLVSCEHLTRRITRTEHDGSITILADRFDGKRFNSPNDVVVKSDGSIWFTDPDFGILSNYEGERQASELGFCGVYRIDGQTSEVALITRDIKKPNGLAFSNDEKQLYIVECDKNNAQNERLIIQYSVQEKAIVSPRIFSYFPKNGYDGIRFDKQGRLWASSHDGVHCINQEGNTIGKIKVPEIVSNICFGGKHGNRLYICGTTSLYANYLNV